ncbi:serine/threonine protein kinase [Evansella halocellulosilytica]|uniref:serine/threonine protein kinase n=1 Tax=Evansella halocellulosilytica TaxID=2011013 RepID=UPI000BB967AA|nr:serine/threonine-protein kinase [Evansella halocellulosilytica]
MSKQVRIFEAGDHLFDKYEVIQVIGSGGMSTVYLVKELANPEQKWAVKVAKMERKISQRLVSEAKLLSELDHPMLPKIADFFSSDHDEYFFLVQEFVNGQTVYDKFEKQDGLMNEADVIELGLQLCEVFRYLHTQSPPVIYRDLKPSNVMISDRNEVKLIDFGIARRHHSGKEKDTLRIGTVGFAAPEQFEKKQSDERTDIFSLGAFMYYLLTGGKYVYISQKPVQRFRKGLSRSLKKSLKHMVRLAPDKRFQSIIEVEQLLQKAKRESERRQQRFFHSTKWLITKYILSIMMLISVLIYIILDYL